MKKARAMRALSVTLFATVLLGVCAAAAVAAPLPAWSPVSVSGPTNLSPTTSEIQTVQVSATGGTFTLGFGGQSTAPLPSNAKPHELEAALNTLSTVGGVGGSVAVLSTFSGGGCNGSATCFVRFGGSLADTDVAEMIPNGSGLTGGTVTVSTKTPGGAPGAGQIAVYVQNVGGAASSAPPTVVDELPPGLTTSETPTGEGWSCLPAGAGQSTVTCTPSGGPPPIEPGKTTKPILIPVRVSAAPSVVQNKVEASGGGAPAQHFQEDITVSPVPASPGFQVFTASANEADGSETTLAGSHPYTANSAIFVNTRLALSGKVVPAGDPKTIRVNTPPGFLGDPLATPQCPEALKDSECNPDTTVGLAQPVIENFGSAPFFKPVHSVQAPLGYPAKFQFEILAEEIPVVGRVRSDEDYGLAIESPNTPQISGVLGVFFSLWGTPAASSHDAQRGGPGAAQTAFLTVPTDCALEKAQQPIASLEFDTWLTPGQFTGASVPVHRVEGCDQLPPLSPSLIFQPEKHSSATPSAFTVDLQMPQKGLTEPGERAEPALKESVVTLPPGVVVNPSSAGGLATCSTQQIGLKGTGFAEPNRIRFTKASPQCPDASKIGTVEVKTPVLANTLDGTLYLAAQEDNPFHSLLAVYLVVDDPTTGILIKLPGRVEPNPVTGQLTTVFDDGPQLPFNDLKLRFKGGERSALATPDVCGKATTAGKFTPWSAPESGPAATTTDLFEVTSGPGGGACAAAKAQRPLHPSFSAGTTGTTAGAYAPFEFRVSRADGEQELKGLEFTLPKGLTGKLAGIPYCSDAQIAAARQATGKAERTSSSCPAASQLGTVTSGAGIGGEPIYVSGRLYLAGPYKGAPISAVVITPAVAGPYDLGDVVVRSPLYVDPVTAQLTAKTDSIPDILQGIPLQLRSIKVSVDRSSFTLNPTSCERMSIGARMIGAGGDTVSSSDDVGFGAASPFKVDKCSALGFAPKFSGSLKGGTKRNDNPVFTSTLAYPKGSYSNIASIAVTLPHSEFLDQSHIRTVCTRVQFAADQCPKGAVYGHATATTPLLDQPLTGPVYLRSSDNKLPDLVVTLKGPATQPIEVDLAGRIDSVKGGIRTTFAAVPDAPVSKFTLKMQGGKKGLLVNSRNLCSAGGGRMTVRMIAHNNKRADQFPSLKNQCGKKRKNRKGHNRPKLSRIFAIW